MLNKSYLPLKSKAPLYLINGEPVSEEVFRENEPIFKYKEYQNKSVSINDREELKSEIERFIAIAKSKSLKDTYKDILKMPDKTVEQYERKLFIFNNGELREEDEIDDYDNNKNIMDFANSNSYKDYCKSTSARAYPLIPLILNLFISIRAPICLIGLMFTIPLTFILSAAEKKRVAELHIDYGLSHGLTENDYRIQRDKQSIHESKIEKLSGVSTIVSECVHTKRSVDYIKDPDLWHKI